MGWMRDMLRSWRQSLRRRRNKGGKLCDAPDARRLQGHFVVVPEQDPLCPLMRHSGRINRGVNISRDVDVDSSGILGTGMSGSVVVGAKRASGQRLAVKTFSKAKLKDRQLKRLVEEVNVHLQVDHPNICRLLHAYEKGDKVWMVMELCRCELYHRLRDLRVFSERRAQETTVQMLKAVSYLHSHNIVHRDLKLENWMYSSADGPERLKLIDFGFAARLSSPDEVMSIPCGTILYVSPELLQQHYTLKTDVWSLGVIVYMVLTGKPPFKGANDTKTAQQIQHGTFYRESRWQQLAEAPQYFVSSLLNKDADARPSARAALRHPWLATPLSHSAVPPAGSDGTVPSQSVEAPGNLWRFGHGSQLQRAVLRALACGLTSRDLERFEQTFLELDTAGRGTISREDLQAVVRSHCPGVSGSEIDQIFDSLDIRGVHEVTYSGFVTAMLAACLDEHEEKVRQVFDAFDSSGTGYLTADSLCTAFVSPAMTMGRSDDSDANEPWLPALSRSEAEAWMAEVDYKGNGTLDFEGFFAALQGKRREISTLQDGDRPAVKVFSNDVHRATSSPLLCASSSASTRDTSADLSESSWELSVKVQPSLIASWTHPEARGEDHLDVCKVAYEVDTSYFAVHS